MPALRPFIQVLFGLENNPGSADVVYIFEYDVFVLDFMPYRVGGFGPSENNEFISSIGKCFGYGLYEVLHRFPFLLDEGICLGDYLAVCFGVSGFEPDVFHF